MKSVGNGLLIRGSQVQVLEGEQDFTTNTTLSVSGFFMYFIYILYSEKSDKYYVGHTDDVNQRLLEHNTSERITFTSKHRPWKIMAVYECGAGRGEVLKIERFIKRQKNRKLIEKLITGCKFDGVIDQLVRVPYVRD